MNTNERGGTVEGDFSELAGAAALEGEKCVFAGDLFLRLANAGALVLDADEADLLIAELTATLDEVRCRRGLNTVVREQFLRASVIADGEVVETAVDAAFIEQVAPGRLDWAVEEIPKYIEAFQIAKGPRHPAAGS